MVLARSVSGPYTIVERSDWSRYDNGRYVGHTYRELRASLRPVAESTYRGEFFVYQETLRDLRQSARLVDSVVPVEFAIGPQGELKIQRDAGYPSLRGFPSYPREAVSAGARWVAQGQRAVDPRNDGAVVVMPIAVQYEYRGLETYKGIAVHRIFAKYATRYRSAMGGDSRAGSADLRADARAANGTGQDKPFTSASGTHDVDILISAADGLPLMMRDSLDETFTWADGSTVRFRGFTLTFGEGSLPLDRGSVVAKLQNVLEGGPSGMGGAKPAVAAAGGGVAGSDDSGAAAGAGIAAAGTGPGGSSPAAASGRAGGSGPAGDSPEGGASAGTGDSAGIGSGSAVSMGPEVPQIDLGDFELAASASAIDIGTVPEGIRLRIRSLRFQADSDALLPLERSRLDLVAQALKEAGDRMFLVEGHTAAVGKPSGEQELSVARAKRIVEELGRRGIPAERFLYKGWGGTRPLSDNGTEEGRAANRRVEITILD